MPIMTSGDDTTTSSSVYSSDPLKLSLIHPPEPMKSFQSSSSTDSQISPDHPLLHHHRPSNSSSPSPPKSSSQCFECGLLIRDRYYLLTENKKWHTQCLKCSECKSSLGSESSCFSREGRFFCKEDYYRLFAVRHCSRCGRGIYASDLVMRVRHEKIYHLSCFTCAWCNVPLSQGDYFGISGNLVYCRIHYEMRNLSASHLDFPHHTFHPGEHAVHPSPDHPLHPDHPIPGLSSVYSSIYGSPGHHHFLTSNSSAASALMNDHLNQANGTSARNEPIDLNNTNAVIVPSGPKKGRPRKRKVIDGIDSKGPLVNVKNVFANISPADQSHNPSHQMNLEETEKGHNFSGKILSENCSNSNNNHEKDISVTSPLISCCPSSNNLNSNRTKRMRTSFKHHQLKQMKTYFALNQNPDAKDLKQLSVRTGLTKRVLQVWFQNARAKWRRNITKQSMGTTHGMEECKASMDGLSGMDSPSYLSSEAPMANESDPGSNYNSLSPSNNSTVSFIGSNTNGEPDTDTSAAFSVF